MLDINRLVCHCSALYNEIRGVPRPKLGGFTSLLGGSGGMLPQDICDSVSFILVISSQHATITQMLV